MTLRREETPASPRLSLLADDSADVQVHGDERRLELALLNVLRNALHAATSRVELRVYGEGNTVVFEVRDDGPGLSAPPEVVLQPFWSSKPSGEGSGLGLAISAAILEEHDGSVSLEDGEDGAIAQLRLPTADIASERDA